MSCGGCVANVQQSLLKVPGVTGAEVQLNPPTAVISTSKTIHVGDLQAQLTQAGHYTIKELA